MKSNKNWSSTLAALLCLILLTSFAYAESPAGMKLFAMSCGTLSLDKGGVLTGGVDEGKIITVPVPMFLIVHPKGLVVFDTGNNPEVAKDAAKYWGERNASRLRPNMKPEDAIDKQVAKLGYNPQEVKYVIQSHMHLDHSGGFSLFSQATFIMRRAELQTAWWPESWQRGSYIFRDYNNTRDWKFIELGYEDYDIFDDGSLILIDTKGHTQGHQSLIINLPKSGKMVLMADACYMPETINKKILPARFWSWDESMRSLKKLEVLRDKGARIVFGHDPDTWRSVKVAPAYYE